MRATSRLHPRLRTPRCDEIGLKAQYLARVGRQKPQRRTRFAARPIDAHPLDRRPMYQPLASPVRMVNFKLDVSDTFSSSSRAIADQPRYFSTSPIRSSRPGLFPRHQIRPKNLSAASGPSFLARPHSRFLAHPSASERRWHFVPTNSPSPILTAAIAARASSVSATSKMSARSASLPTSSLEKMIADGLPKKP